MPNALKLSKQKPCKAYQFLEERGFRNFMGEGKLLVTPFFKGAHMESPSGFGIMLMQHIKD